MDKIIVNDSIVEIRDINDVDLIIEKLLEYKKYKITKQDLKNNILKGSSEYFNLDEKNILERDNTYNKVKIRAFISKLLYDNSCTLVEIALLLHRHHSTIISLVNDFYYKFNKEDFNNYKNYITCYLNLQKESKSL